MGVKKIYTGDYEAKLSRVMERFGVEKYNYDWSRTDCFVEFIYKKQLYRFEHSIQKAADSGQKILYTSDLFAQLVITLEDLVRMSERGIYELSTWIEGMKALPAAASIPTCFQALGFSEIPDTKDQLKKQYHKLAQIMHPDTGGDEKAFLALNDNYLACQKIMLNQKGETI